MSFNTCHGEAYDTVGEPRKRQAVFTWFMNKLLLRAKTNEVICRVLYSMPRMQRAQPCNNGFDIVGGGSVVRRFGTT